MIAATAWTTSGISAIPSNYVALYVPSSSGIVEYHFPGGDASSIAPDDTVATALPLPGDSFTSASPISAVNSFGVAGSSLCVFVGSQATSTLYIYEMTSQSRVWSPATPLQANLPNGINSVTSTAWSDSELCSSLATG